MCRLHAYLAQKRKVVHGDRGARKLPAAVEPGDADGTSGPPRGSAVPEGALGVVDQSDVAEPHSEHHKEDHKEDGQGSHHAGHVHGEQRAEDEVPRWKVVWNGAGATRAARACGGRRVPAGLIAARAHAACGMRML